MDSQRWAEKLDENGFVHCRGVLTDELVLSIRAHAQRCVEAVNRTGAHVVARPTGADVLGFSALLTRPELVRTARAALSPDVKMSLLEVVSTGREDGVVSSSDQLIALGYDASTGVGVHRDGAWIERDLAMASTPRLTLKAAVWLSNVEKGGANLRLFPRTHALDRSVVETLDPATLEFFDVEAEAGDVTFFDRRTLHTRTWNHSNRERLVVFVEYSVTWLCRKQPFRVCNLLANHADQVLLGDLLKEPTDPWSHYWP
ncbi:phytanoyl-CoA dioxygenase family protein [Burkholderia sola]|uniref:phytanoyl-CoA dioxygenase family protein n=1 Tax=Burkholderia TaxID=32008 RepID=UPI001AE58755|nr:phytanoyl-CoA dioxygenase family protein [Burkholderia sp. AcTa6-5]MBP0714300.1 phytanoyl-CoA dioxygenase family protein [Burkholderia sp. AcTa6-5]